MCARLSSRILVLDNPVVGPGRSCVKPVTRAPQILIADDDDEGLEIFRIYLEHLRMRVFATNNPASAVELARLGWPDLIVCEWALVHPGTGRLIVEVLRSSQDTSSIPRLVVTSRVFPAESLEELRGQCANLITKPVGLKALGSAIQSILVPDVLEFPATYSPGIA